MAIITMAETIDIFLSFESITAATRSGFRGYLKNILLSGHRAANTKIFSDGDRRHSAANWSGVVSEKEVIAGTLVSS